MKLLLQTEEQRKFMCCCQVKTTKSFNKLVAQLDVDKAICFLRRGDFAKATDALRSATTSRIAFSH